MDLINFCLRRNPSMIREQPRWVCRHQGWTLRCNAGWEAMPKSRWADRCRIDARFRFNELGFPWPWPLCCREVTGHHEAVYWEIFGSIGRQQGVKKSQLSQEAEWYGAFELDQHNFRSANSPRCLMFCSLYQLVKTVNGIDCLWSQKRRYCCYLERGRRQGWGLPTRGRQRRQPWHQIRRQHSGYI